MAHTGLADLRAAERAVAGALARDVSFTSARAGYIGLGSIVVSVNLTDPAEAERALTLLSAMPGCERTEQAGDDDVFVRVYFPRAKPQDPASGGRNLTMTHTGPLTAQQLQAITWAMQRETEAGGITWGEIECLTVAQMCSVNQDALIDDLYEEPDLTAARRAEILALIKVYDGLLGTDRASAITVPQ